MTDVSNRMITDEEFADLASGLRYRFGTQYMNPENVRVIVARFTELLERLAAYHDRIARLEDTARDDWADEEESIGTAKLGDVEEDPHQPIPYNPEFGEVREFEIT